MAYKAFVSSTFEDLKDHRRIVITALRKAGITVDPMEEWTAASDEPKRLSADRVKDCDLCILLVAFRRGHVPEGATLSITQLEHQAALELGIDVLVFMLKEESKWQRKFDELDKDPDIRRWREQLMQNSTVGFFDHEPTSIDIASATARWVAAARRRANPGDVILGTWKHYSSPPEKSEFTFNSRFVVAKSDQGYVMSVLEQADDSETEPSIGLYDVKSDGQVWTFKSNWRQNRIGIFELHRVTADLFEGHAKFEDHIVQRDRFMRVHS